MPFKSPSQSKLCVLDCVTGARSVVTSIGSTQASNLRMWEPGCPAGFWLVSAGAKDQASVELSDLMVVDGVTSQVLLCGVGEERGPVDASIVPTFRLKTDFKGWMAGITIPCFSRQPIFVSFQQNVWMFHHLLIL